MSNLLYLQLENEQVRLSALRKENRKDAIACIVMDRIEREIYELERKIDVAAKARKEGVKSKHTGRLARYVRQALHRFRNYQNRRDYSVFQVSTETVLQASGGGR